MVASDSCLRDISTSMYKIAQSWFRQNVLTTDKFAGTTTWM
jgi:hypothetical protein